MQGKYAHFSVADSVEEVSKPSSLLGETRGPRGSQVRRIHCYSFLHLLKLSAAGVALLTVRDAVLATLSHYRLQATISKPRKSSHALKLQIILGF